MIGSAIVRLREREGLSQADLAERLGMKSAQLCLIERGRVNPKAQTVARIAKALGVDLVLQLGDEMSAAAALIPTRRSLVGLAKVRQELERADAALNALESSRGVISATTVPLVHAYLLEPHSSEILAHALRSSLGVGSAAFADLVWTLEFANIRVRSHVLPKSQPSGGWWCPAKGTLTLAVDACATPERQLYRLAYELGAACLFRSQGDSPLRETKAEHRFLVEFAADFLMPAEAIADRTAKTGIKPNAWTFDQLLLFKDHFGVSAEAFALRLQELGLIDRTLRESFRTRLRAYYASHPGAMEPAPCRAPLNFGVRERMMELEGGET